MRKIIETTWNELWPVVNILNEICHGIKINDFEKQIGFKYDEIFSLLEKIEAYEVKEYEADLKTTLELNDSTEMSILKNCFRVVLKHIEEWEFSTRIGVSISEATAIINKLTEPH